MTAPYDALAALSSVAMLLATPEGQRLLARLLGDAGVTQEQLEEAVRAAGAPRDPTVPRSIPIEEKEGEES